MLQTLHWYFIAMVLIGSVAGLAICAPEKPIYKAIALGLTTLFLPVSYLAANDLLSRPKPLEQELLQSQLDQAVVLSSYIKDKQSIFIWLKVDGVEEPRSYRLPWSEDTAVELHKAQTEAEAQGVEMTMTLPEGESSGTFTPEFQVNAPPPLPPKPTE